MPERFTTPHTAHSGIQVTVRGVPSRFSEAGEALGFTARASVTRQLGALIQEAVQQADGQQALELTYRALETQPGPVSTELRRALRQRGSAARRSPGNWG